MKKISVFLMFLMLAAGSMAQNVTISIVVEAPGLSKDSAVYITGSLPELGNWNPDKIKMEYKTGNTWVKQLRLTKGQSFEYKFTRGQWTRQAANANGAALQNFKLNVTSDTLVMQRVLKWTLADVKPPIQGQITGTVKYHRNVVGPGLKPRDLIIWLPKDYDANSTKRYSVIYMQDGQNVFDPATSSFGVDWQIDESVDSLINHKAIEPVIVVGIYNTADRTKEYMPGGLSKQYMEFIANQVKPMIDQTYRTLPDAAHTIVGGSSAGGILAFMMVWEHPDKFSKAICMSPAFKIEQWDYVKNVQDSPKRKGLKFYIDNGGIDLEARLQPGVTAMLAALKEKGYQQQLDFLFVADPKASHSEAAWAKRFPEALKWIMTGKH